MKRGKIDTSKMTKGQIEKLSKNNAIKIIQGRDSLKSWGKSGWLKVSRLRKWFQYRSSIELNVLKILDQNADYIVDFDTECFYIPYKMYDGSNSATLNYVPDVILKTSNNNTFVIEVKPVAQLQEEKNLAKWKTAKAWCAGQGCKFLVITEKDWPNLIDILKMLENKDLPSAQKLLEWQL